jgi:hypothetical protein
MPVEICHIHVAVSYNWKKRRAARSQAFCGWSERISDKAEERYEKPIRIEDAAQPTHKKRRRKGASNKEVGEGVIKNGF